MKILIVDDHIVLRRGIVRLFESIPGAVMEEAGTVRDALVAARRQRPDVVVLDISLKEASGLELLKRMRLEWPDLRVVVFSMYAEPVYATTALRLGALGFVSKSAQAEELVAAVRRAAVGEAYLDSETARAMVKVPTPSGQGAAVLSNRELEILRLLADGKSLTGISETLGVAYKTVANQCTRIKEKLGLGRTADLIRFALENVSENRAVHGMPRSEA